MLSGEELLQAVRDNKFDVVKKLIQEGVPVNVILAFSEHAFPLRLRLADPKLGFNLEDITELLYSGEVAPNEIFKLLTQEWKLSENLSLAIISLYGGHIWDIYQALMRLREMKENFYTFDAVYSFNQISRSVSNAVLIRKY